MTDFAAASREVSDSILQWEEVEARKELSDAHMLVKKFNMDELVWNHISTKLSDGNVLITPGQMMWDEIKPEHIVKASSSIANVTADVIHRAIYSAREDIRAVVHLHTPAAVAVSCLEMGYVPLAQEAAPFIDRVFNYPWDGISTDYDEQASIAAAVKAASKDCNTMLMENHGYCCFGRTIGEAWVLAYYFDKSCRTQLNCLSTGQAIRHPAREVMLKAQRVTDQDENRAGVHEWEALRRSLV
jgi:ribulose-5-phosphate 4-epimerase/fuculose-1-phosphate aldolase